MAAKKILSVLVVAAGASLLAVVPANAQEDTNYHGYDKSFIDRPDHKKPTNPFAVTGDMFHKHSYRRMLLNSPFANSSVGLGANSSNQIYNKEAYNYLNPDANKANDETPEEVNRYIDHVYSPNVGKSDNQGYHTQKDFDQENPFKTGAGTQSSLTEANPFGNTFDANNNPYFKTNSNKYNHSNYGNAFTPATSPVSGRYQTNETNNNNVEGNSQSNF